MSMDVYMIIFIASSSIFLIQFILSILSGIDLDFNLELGEDIDDIVSFKGLVHFALGFSSVVVLFGDSAVFIILGIFVGLGLMYILSLLYKYMSSIEQTSSSIDDLNLVGYRGLVVAYLGNSQYLLQVRTPIGVSDLIVTSKSGNTSLSGQVVVIRELSSDNYLID